MVEYAVLLSLIALALVGPVLGLGQQVGNRFQSITSTLANGGGDSGLPGGGGDGGGTTPPPTTTTPPPTTSPTTPDPETPTTPDPEPETGGTVDPSKTPLKDVTWEELDKLSPDAAKDPDKYKDWIGQEIPVIVNNKKVDAQLVGIGQDKDESGNPVGFSFITKQLVGKAPYVDGMGPNAYRDNDWWPSSSMYKTVNDTIGPTLKDVSGTTSLSDIVTPAAKLHCPPVANGRVSNPMTQTSKFWIPSGSEVFGTKSSTSTGIVPIKSNQVEGEQYQYYANKLIRWPDAYGAVSDAIKTLDGEPESWWLRSINAETTNNQRPSIGNTLLTVTSEGNYSNLMDTYSCGIALGFCV